MLEVFKWFGSVDSYLFILIETNIVVGSLGIIILPTIIYAALCLAFVFINIALLYLLLNAEFLAAVQVLIYVGAINVLIVFAIMLVNSSTNTLNNTNNSNLADKISVIPVVCLFGFLLTMILQTPMGSLSVHIENNNVQKIGTILLQDLLIPFELLSLLLLVALVGAVTIAGKEKAKLR